MDLHSPETPGRVSLRLDVYSPPQVLQIHGRLCHLVLRPTRHDPTCLAIPHVPKGEHLVQWYRSVTNEVRGARKIMIVALARKLLIALWRMVRTGEVPGVAFRAA